MVLGVPVRAKVENQSGNKHVESLKIRRLDEGSNPSGSTGKICKPLVLKELGVSFFKGTELGTEKFILIDFLHQKDLF